MQTVSNKQRPLHPSIQAKLQLLQNIQKGNFERVAQLAYALSKVGRTNPELYQKLSSFVNQHKQQIVLTNKEDYDPEPQIINVQDDFVQGKEYDSDESIQYQQSQNDEQQVQPVKDLKRQNSVKRGLFKQINNFTEKSKSTSKNITKQKQNTYQFKQPIATDIKDNSTKNVCNQVHRNSAINKSKVPKVK